jgi:hypothetical protein
LRGVLGGDEGAGGGAIGTGAGAGAETATGDHDATAGAALGWDSAGVSMRAADRKGSTGLKGCLGGGGSAKKSRPGFRAALRGVAVGPGSKTVCRF